MYLLRGLYKKYSVHVPLAGNMFFADGKTIYDGVVLKNFKLFTSI